MIEVIVTWCVMTTAALHKLDTQATDNCNLTTRAYCLFLYYGWAVVSTVVLVPVRVQQQSEHTSINMTTVTAIVLLLASLLNHLQLCKQTAAWCSRLLHQIPALNAWLATAVIMWIAHREVFCILLGHGATIAQYKQAKCFWLSADTCTSSTARTILAESKGFSYCLLGFCLYQVLWYL
jgi:hypothetical protein